MPPLGGLFWVTQCAAHIGYYALIVTFLKQLLFVVYGLYLDLCLTRIYLDVLRTKESQALCAWSEQAQGCVSPESEFSYIAVVGQKGKIRKIWTLSGYRWFFACSKTHRCHFMPHEHGWFPSSMKVETATGAYHQATLSWGGRLSFKSSMVKSRLSADSPP